MISDEELKRYSCISNSNLVRELRDMATELLAYRQEKRKAEEARAKSWKGAPEWANCRARDQGRGWIYLELKPYAGTDEEWASIKHSRGTSIPPSTIIQWIATLETRP